MSMSQCSSTSLASTASSASSPGDTDTDIGSITSTRGKDIAVIFVGAEQVAHKQALDKLTTVSLRGEPVHDVLAGSLVECVALEEVDLRETLIQDWAAIERLVTQLPALRVLNVSGNPLGPIPAEIIPFVHAASVQVRYKALGQHTYSLLLFAALAILAEHLHRSKSWCCQILAQPGPACCSWAPALSCVSCTATATTGRYWRAYPRLVHGLRWLRCPWRTTR